MRDRIGGQRILIGRERDAIVTRVEDRFGDRDRDGRASHQPRHHAGRHRGVPGIGLAARRALEWRAQAVLICPARWCIEPEVSMRAPGVAEREDAGDDERPNQQLHGEPRRSDDRARGRRCRARSVSKKRGSGSCPPYDGAAAAPGMPIRSIPACRSARSTRL